MRVPGDDHHMRDDSDEETGLTDRGDGMEWRTDQAVRTISTQRMMMEE